MMRSGALPGELRRDFPVAARLLALRLTRTGDLPLAAIREGAPVLTRLGPALEAALPAAGPSLRRELRGGATGRLARTMGRALTRHLMRMNQYLPLPAGWDRSADELYEVFLDEFVASADRLDATGRTLAAHQGRLRGLLRAREGSCLAQDEPVCATYSPDLQLRLMRLEPRRMPSPILDLGCGERGALVHHLRAHGRTDAWGVDPLCETGGPLIRGSWFDLPLRPGTWGTIIAHQSFSLHLLRAHGDGSDAEAVRHVRTFMRVLEALAPGGSFHYAPALPFLEDLLPPDRWKARRADLPVRAPDGRAFQATRVSRRPRG